MFAQAHLVASYFPYNAAQQPRRFDYVWNRGLRVVSGQVVEKSRVIVGSDPDAVSQ